MSNNRNIRNTIEEIATPIMVIASILFGSLLQNIFIIIPAILIFHNIFASALLAFVMNIVTMIPLVGMIALIILMTAPIVMGKAGIIYLAYYVFFIVTIIGRILIITRPPEEI